MGGGGGGGGQRVCCPPSQIIGGGGLAPWPPSFYAYVLCLFIDFKLDEPRQIGVNGQLLPSPRHISSTVHRGDGAEVLASDLTLMMMVFGQFTDHDFALTPISAGKSIYSRTSMARIPL